MYFLSFSDRGSVSGSVGVLRSVNLTDRAKTVIANTTPRIELTHDKISTIVNLGIIASIKYQAANTNTQPTNSGNGFRSE